MRALARDTPQEERSLLINFKISGIKYAGYLYLILFLRCNIDLEKQVTVSSPKFGIQIFINTFFKILSSISFAELERRAPLSTHSLQDGQSPGFRDRTASGEFEY